MYLRLTDDGYLVRSEGTLRPLLSDPFSVPPTSWVLADPLDGDPAPLAPLQPGKVVGVGRNYVAHAEELGNPMPDEPLLFLKAPTSVVGPGEPVVLPPESERVEHEGEVAVVIGRRLCRADAATAQRAILGVTCACDITARDLQRRDATFARGKSFDSFCPLGPEIRIGADLDSLEVVTRVSGQERQRGSAQEMHWSTIELLVYISRMMTLLPGDVVLTGTPAGVGPLVEGDTLEVEIPGVGTLRNPVTRLAPA